MKSMIFNKSQLKRLILAETIDPNAVYQSETGEVLDRGDLYDMIRDFSKELTGDRDLHGSYDKLDSMDIQQLDDYYQDMFQSEDYEKLRWVERDPIGPSDKDSNLTRAELAPKKQGFGRRPKGSKSQRRMENKVRIKRSQLIKIIKEELDQAAMEQVDAKEPDEVEPIEDAWAGGDNLTDPIDLPADIKESIRKRLHREYAKYNWKRIIKKIL